jgi:hypothetical protein
MVNSEETSIAGQLLGKHIPLATNMQAAVELLPLPCNGALNTPSQQMKQCFLWVHLEAI